jgi:hypothetical protein
MQTQQVSTGPSLEGLFLRPASTDTWKQSFNTIGVDRLYDEGFHELEFNDGDINLKRKDGALSMYIHMPRNRHVFSVSVRIHLTWLNDAHPDVYATMTQDLFDKIVHKHINNRQLYMLLGDYSQ